MSDKPTLTSLSPQQRRALLARLLRETVSEETLFPLSHGQRALWVLYRLAPTSAAYNVAFTATLRSEINVPCLRRALATLVGRHEMLRVTVDDRDGTPVQRVAPRIEVSLDEIDASTWSPDELKDHLGRSYRLPFDLEKGPVFRASLYRRSPEKHVLLLAVHHLAVDAWSIGLLVSEWMTSYAVEREGASGPLVPLSTRYADFVRWQEELLAGAEGNEMLSYWRRQLRSPLPSLQIPTDRPRPAFPSFRGGTHEFRIDEAMTGALRDLARREGTTLFSVLLAAFGVLLFRYSGQDDILVGSPTAGRSRQEFEGLVGYFVNPVVLRADLSGDPTFVEMVSRTRVTVIDALKHADYPFPLVVQHLNPDRDASRSPLFQAEFNLVKLSQLGVGREALSAGAVSSGTLAGLRMETFALPQQEGQFDLGFEVVDLGGSLLANLKYATDLFEASTIGQMGEHLQTLVRGLVAEPTARVSAVPMLTEGERQTMAGWNATARAYPPDRSLHELIEHQVERTPNAVAVQSEGGRLTFGELDARACQLARHLRHLRVGPEVLVGVAMERSLEMVVALLGILKAGGAYVPLDPTYPRERLSYMMDDARVPVLLTQQHLLGELPATQARVLALDTEWPEVAAESAQRLDPVGTSENLAYMIYTSGSTGRPKGAMNAHRGIVNRLLWMQEAYGLGADDVVLQKTPFSFDVSVWEFFWPLLAGARLVMARPEGHKDPSYLVQAIADERVTTIHFVPAMLQVFLEEPGLDRCASLRRVVCSGEALPAQLCARFFERFDCELHNLYGPTEAAVDVTYFHCRPEDRRSSIPIGRPVANTQIHVLGPGLDPVPVGVAGELHLGGVQVGRGYLGRPDLTAERFIPDPFGLDSGGRLYKTGDLARLLPDGNVEYLGRLDHQVKIRGFRIELGEIEAAIARHPAVREAVVLAREDRPGDRRLVAYVVAPGPPSVVEDGLRSRLRAELPDHMVPSAIVLLDALPLSPNGKVDRRALAELKVEGEQPTGSGHVAPRTATEEILAGIWESILQIGRVGFEGDFFALGGHSLLATQMVSRARKAFGVELPLREVFAAPTVERLARRIDELRQRGSSVLAGPPALVRGATPGPAPLSFAQERLWFLDQVEPGSAAYVIPGAVELRGRLDVRAMEQALGEIVRRHEPLRTTFASVDGRPVQVVTEGTSLLSLPVRDLATGPDGQYLNLLEEVARQGFDLEEGPLFRVVLYRLRADHHVLLVCMHHIVSDGWSLGVLIQELTTLYRAFSQGEAATLPQLPVQYRDFARWQREWLGKKETVAAELEHWRSRLAGAPHVLALPTDRPRPPVETHCGAIHAFTIEPDVEQGLRAVARREGATLFMALLTALEVVLSRWTQQRDFLIGTPLANRRHSELEDLIGLFVNTLVLRADLGGDPTYLEMLSRVRETCMDAYAHQDLPFEKLVDELRPERDPSRNPLFQVMFVLQNAPMTPFELPGLLVQGLGLDRAASQVDLTLYVQETPNGLRGTFEYATDLFEASTIERMEGHLQALLRGIVAEPTARISALSMLTEGEREALSRWNATGVELPEACVHELIAERAAAAPERVVVECGEGSCTFGDLEARAERLAGVLRDRGVGPGVLVGLYMERSLEMLAALLGVWKAGGAYVPLDPGFPAERLSYMVEDSGAALLVTQAGLVASLPTRVVPSIAVDEFGQEAGPGLARRSGVRGAVPDDLAYVIYTSGSTGRPKGVAITHRALLNLLLSMGREPGLGEGDVLLSVTTLSFDIAALELYLPLLVGARVYVASRQDALDGHRLIELLDQLGATVMQATPATWRMLIEAGWERTQSLKVLCGGEALPRDLAEALLARSGEVWNVYGPTETTVWSSVERVGSGKGPVSIGRPIANTQMWVLDRNLELLPVGISGELHIGGAGVARGYWGRPDLTAEKFVPDPFTGEAGGRLYRTGDLARWLPDGRLEALGRIDHQVKIRGFRIELGEIEASLRTYPAVEGAVVLAQEETDGDRKLVAYLTSTAAATLSVTEVREHLRRTLPAYMVPSSFVFVDSFPLTPNGKVDRRALARHEESRPSETRLPPRTDMEKLVAEVWRELLGVEAIGARDNFFDLGGHSLLAVRALSRIEARVGGRLNLRDMVSQTLEQFASAIEVKAEPASTVPDTLALSLRRFVGRLRARRPRRST